MGQLDATVQQLLPLLTAVLTLANTIVLFVVNQRTSHTASHVNGLVLQQMREAEERGRRLERRRPRHHQIGK